VRVYHNFPENGVIGNYDLQSELAEKRTFRELKQPAISLRKSPVFWEMGHRTQYEGIHEHRYLDCPRFLESCLPSGSGDRPEDPKSRNKC